MASNPGYLLKNLLYFTLTRNGVHETVIGIKIRMLFQKNLPTLLVTRSNLGQRKTIEKKNVLKIDRPKLCLACINT